MMAELFTTASLDPPWPEKGAGKIKRGADRHYDLIKKKEDILRVVLQSGKWNPAPDAHCYIWVTNNYLTWGTWLMEALGFRYITNIAWVKVKEDWPDAMFEDGMSLEAVLDDIIRRGLGQYFAGAHELCLFGVRGKTMKPEKALRSAFAAPRPKGEDGKEKHSKKPEKIYEIIESVSPGPYIEFFARSGREKWSNWGDEAPNQGGMP